MTRWLDPPHVDASPLASLHLPPLIAQTLLRRGISRPEEAEAFLHPEKTPSTPFPDIEKAVDLISLAIRNKDRICVWGDFDVDGQTSTALLVQTLGALGADVVYYIPVRGKESHGVHIESLKPILDGGVKLLLTCDTGITAHEAIDYCNARGVDVIVTDHHDLGETLPNAKAIINPKLLPEDHPLKNLAGVGVAYKLAEALLDGRPQTEDRPPSTVHGLRSIELLDLVALGLIADVALLRGETRSLAQKGIQALRSTNRLGLKVMAELSSTNLETLTEETIGFTFAPRLNALGRLSDANPAVELLITNDSARARVLAAQIEGLNAQRRLLTSQVTEAAEAQLRDNPDLLTEPAILLSHPNWPGGVVGIVANRLVDRYHKPALLLTESEDGILRGSARSVEGLHITEAIAANKDLLLGFGGHPMAAGLSLQKDNLIAFRRGLGKAVERQLGGIIREEPTLQIDAWLGLDEISLSLADAIEMLAPFGAGQSQTDTGNARRDDEICDRNRQREGTPAPDGGRRSRECPKHSVVGRRGRGTAGKRGKVRHCLFPARLVISRRETGIFAVRGIPGGGGEAGRGPKAETGSPGHASATVPAEPPAFHLDLGRRRGQSGGRAALRTASGG